MFTQCLVVTAPNTLLSKMLTSLKVILYRVGQLSPDQTVFYQMTWHLIILTLDTLPNQAFFVPNFSSFDLETKILVLNLHFNLVQLICGQSQ